jgi:probable phosphoglycerate mutase
VIKGIIADCLGLHLDMSQRIQADPCSLTVIRYTPLRPFLVRMNDTGGGVEDLMPAPSAQAGRNGRSRRRGESDAVVGGGAGGNGRAGGALAEVRARVRAVRERSRDARG